jgi:hypothetical protein
MMDMHVLAGAVWIGVIGALVIPFAWLALKLLSLWGPESQPRFLRKLVSDEAPTGMRIQFCIWLIGGLILSISGPVVVAAMGLVGWVQVLLTTVLVIGGVLLGCVAVAGLWVLREER